MLHYKVSGEGKPLVLVHGLFGSLENVGAIARLLSSDFKVYSVDLPNHGRSPHKAGMDLAHMAECVSNWMGSVGLSQAFLVGHSLGGKVAMEIALSQPERVEKVVVIDIAPVTYAARHLDVFAGINAVDPAAISSRGDAEAIASAYIKEPAVLSFILKNLVRTETGFEWRMNLQDLQEQYPTLIHENLSGAVFAKPVLFLKGGDSDYIRPDCRNNILQRFPQAQLKVIPNTGHWLHAEKPDLTATLIRKFLLAATGVGSDASNPE